ncbi:uncharacterized protein LOC143963908 [Lithobates pipiens]
MLAAKSVREAYPDNLLVASGRDLPGHTRFTQRKLCFVLYSEESVSDQLLKEQKPEYSMVEFTSQEQTLTSDQVQEETECGELIQDVCLKPWDLTPGPSTDLAIVDVKSPDMSHTEGQSDPEEEESIREPLLCASILGICPQMCIHVQCFDVQTKHSLHTLAKYVVP